MAEQRRVEEKALEAKRLHVAEESLRVEKEKHRVSMDAYLLAQREQELRREEIANDNMFQVVFKPESLRQFSLPVANSAVIDVSFTNNSIRTRSYEVMIEGSGVAVSERGLYARHINNRVRLDAGTIVLSPNTTYRNSFQVWHAKEPVANAAVRVLVNGKIELEQRYRYCACEHVYKPISQTAATVLVSSAPCGSH